MKPAAALLALLLAALPAAAFDLQGHRGARGLAPENTLAAFRTALALGVDTLELDLMFTADGVPVVSHDPALNPDLTRDAAGRWLESPGPLIRSLTLAQLQAFDVGRARPGSRVAQDFPDQRPADGERVPRLAEVLALASPATRFNIELKRDPTRPERYAEPAAMVEGLLAAVQAAGVAGRVTVQSFDWGVLQRWQQRAPAIPTAYLSIQRPSMNNVDSPDWTAGFSLAAQGSVPRMVKAAGGRVWSPFFRDLTEAQVREAQGLGLQVIPWTVNDPADMARLLAWKVDGLISDHPDRALPLRR